MTIHKRGENGLPKCGARGYYSNSFLRTTDDDSQVTCKRCRGEQQIRHVRVPLADNYVGKIFWTSFGYNMTINRYAVCIRQTASTLTLQECFIHVENDNGRGEGRSVAGERNPNGKIFKVQARSYYSSLHSRPEISYVGGGHYWRLWNGQANYYNTWD